MSLIPETPCSCSDASKVIWAPGPWCLLPGRCTLSCPSAACLLPGMFWYPSCHVPPCICVVIRAKGTLTSTHSRGTDKGASPEPRRQNQSASLWGKVERSQRQGLKQHTSPGKSRARQLPRRAPAPTANELHTRAKVAKALANIPRSFPAPCWPGPSCIQPGLENGGKTGEGLIGAGL